MGRPFPGAVVAVPAVAALAFAACERSPTSSIDVIDVDAGASVQVSATGPADGRIAFSMPGNPGGYDIWVMNPDGSGLTDLTNTEQRDDMDPAWSPDGRRIAFSRNGDIWVMSADGTNQTRLTALLQNIRSRDPSWSPDGSRIAFARAGTIYVVDEDGGGLTALLDDSGNNYDPAWSPDGRKIAFTSVRCDSPPCIGYLPDIWVMSADGSGLTNLTPGAVGGDEQPSWSPDGSRIAFVSERDGGPSLYVMNADGTDPVRVLSCALFCEHPTWSPDGTRLAFTGKTDEYDVRVLDLASGDVAKLTLAQGNPTFDLSPDWGVTPTHAVPEQIGLLALDVVRLQQSGALNQWQALALNLKLKVALDAWRGGRPAWAVLSMAAFARQVSELIQGGVLTAAEGWPLIGQAVEIVQQMAGASGQPTGQSDDG